MWRKMFKPLGARVVMLIHHDGGVTFSFAKESPLGLIANKIYGKVLLKPDGTTDTYIKKWVEL